MKLKNLIYFSLAFTVGIKLALAVSTQYDNDFEQAYKKGTVKNLVEYVQQLSLSTIQDNKETKGKKCEALKYFFATGGKNGFRKTPATPEEQVLLTKALVITTALHDTLSNSQPLDLLKIRQDYKKPLDSSLQNHFIAAQKITFNTVLIKKIGPHFDEVENAYNNFHSIPSYEINAFLKGTKNFYNKNYFDIVKKIKTGSEDYWFDLFLNDITMSNINFIINTLNLFLDKNNKIKEIEEDEIPGVKEILSQLG